MVEEWVTTAQEHLRAAELLLNEGLYHLVCFHARRAAVLALGTMLEKNGVTAPPSATMLDLLNAGEACDPEAASLRAACALLDLYCGSESSLAVPGMLPWGTPSFEQAEAALEAGRKIVQTLGRVTSRFALAAVA